MEYGKMGFSTLDFMGHNKRSSLQAFESSANHFLRLRPQFKAITALKALKRCFESECQEIHFAITHKVYWLLKPHHA
jgi:hypothetical protein